LFIAAVALSWHTPAAWAAAADAGPADDPLKRNYVDLEIHAGPTWIGNVGDQRWSPIGFGFGTRISVGRAPYWGCIYVDAAFVSARPGVVDPGNNEHPNLLMTSAGWCGKVAIRLAQHLYLFPMVGAGFAILDYTAGVRGRHTFGTGNEARVEGLGIQAEATLEYKWRYGGLTLQPIRATAYLFEHLTEYNDVGASGSGGVFGLARHGIALGASIGLSVDLSGITLAIYDSVHDMVDRARARIAGGDGW
jgi:hypothetical protein